MQAPPETTPELGGGALRGFQTSEEISVHVARSSLHQYLRLMTMSLQTMSSWDRTRGLLLNGHQVSTLSRTHWGIQGGAVGGRQRRRLGPEELAWFQERTARHNPKSGCGRGANSFPLPSLALPNETMGTRGTHGTQLSGLRNQGARRRAERMEVEVGQRSLVERAAPAGAGD